MDYSGQIFALFILCKEAKKISKSLQRKRRNCERKRMKILTLFKLELKDLIIYFGFQRSTETIVDQKTLFGIFFSIFIVVLCNNIFKKFQI